MNSVSCWLLLGDIQFFNAYLFKDVTIAKVLRVIMVHGDLFKSNRFPVREEQIELTGSNDVKLDKWRNVAYCDDEISG